MKNNEFGKRLRELRTERDMSQRQLATVFNVCNQTISFWETGAREPDLDHLVAMARYFDVSIDDLLDAE